MRCSCAATARLPELEKRHRADFDALALFGVGGARWIFKRGMRHETRPVGLAVVGLEQ